MKATQFTELLLADPDLRAHGTNSIAKGSSLVDAPACPLQAEDS